MSSAKFAPNSSSASTAASTRTTGRPSSVMRLDLLAVDQSLTAVEADWPHIEVALANIGLHKDRFSDFLRKNMLTAYEYLDELVATGLAPMSDDSIAQMLKLNNQVHYGNDVALMREFDRAITANADKFYANVGPILKWYRKHRARGDHPYKLAAETYVSILGRPQLFIEGNHRTGSLIASWINLHFGYPPFVLSVENALAYFAPSAEIKLFADKSTWRGRARLPKYRKSFREFWTRHVEDRYVLEKGNN